MDFPDLESNLNGVCDLINILRGPDGCLWDKKQTSNSLTKHLIEECYELVEAIENNDLENIEEEIGDVLLNLAYQIIFLKEKKHSREEIIIEKLYSKIHVRHPHVFSDLQLKNSEEVEKNWENIKKISNNDNSFAIPKYLPSLNLAEKIQKKYMEINSDFDTSDAMKNLQKILINDDEIDSDMFGKILFDLTNIARLKNIDPEKSLRIYIKKYIKDLNEK
jgi:tetrapyrrole methylase family protein/MazG family protein